MISRLFLAPTHWFCLLALLFVAHTSHAGPREDAEAAALALAGDQENAGYMFRAEAWTGELSKDIGKAVKVQLFKGNEQPHWRGRAAWIRHSHHRFRA